MRMIGGSYGAREVANAELRRQWEQARITDPLVLDHFAKSRLRKSLLPVLEADILKRNQKKERRCEFFCCLC